MNKLVIRKCMKCGATVRVLEDCNCENCGIQCCGSTMEEMVANSFDASIEKHVPNYEIKDGKLFVEVKHVMEEDHYIEWISVVSSNAEKTVYFKPEDEPKVHCCIIEPGTTIYAYCNKHGLWSKEIK